MPAKWQRWIPFDIDAFFGSPAVQVMSQDAQMGYLRLICAQWQTDECALPIDPMTLAEKSGMGDEKWAVHGPRILRQFPAIDGAIGLIRNLPCYLRWKEAKRVYDARRDSARKTTETRSPSEKHTVTVDKADGHRHGEPSGPSRRADTQTRTVQDSTEQNNEQKPKPSRAKKRAGGEGDLVDPTKPPTKSDLAKSRHAEFKAIVAEHWKAANPHLEMPWDGREGKNLEMFLRASPTVTAEQFGRFLRRRFGSEVNTAERPAIWLTFLTSYGNGPLDRFGKPLPVRLNQPGSENQRARPLTEIEIYRRYLGMSEAYRNANPRKPPEGWES
jgi:hypothetical protein